MENIGKIIFAIIFNGMIVSALIWSIMSLKRCIKTLKNGIETVGMYTGNQSGGNLIYNVRGQWLSLRLGWTKLSWGVRKTKFVVFYDPDNPHYAYVQKYSLMTCLFRITALGILLACSLALSAFVLLYV